ncbi:MAG: tetratricopeptide repeat protein [Bernardetiaceae bacterium]|nr:tetratricopeptide repeat protein [Bernardetiaceae bacterium]
MSLKHSQWILALFFSFFISASLSAQQEDFMLAEQYYKSEEYEKALALYEKLAQNGRYQSAIHSHYLDVMLRLEQNKEAEKYLKKIVKKFPEDPRFNIDYGQFLRQMKRTKEADKHFQEFSSKVLGNLGNLRRAALEFSNAGLYDYAEQLYLDGKKQHPNHNFAYDLGNLYSLAGKTSKMLKNYMDILLTDPDKVSTIQNILQTRLRDEESWSVLEPVLYEYIQKNPSKMVFNEMLVWYFVQKKDFNNAFIQAKALDKRHRLGGTDIFNIGMQALSNEDYKSAVKIFDYLTKQYEESNIYGRSLHYLMKAKEELIKNTFPVDIEQIRSLVADYKNSIERSPRLNSYTAESARNMASLMAFYLNEKDEAIEVLQELIKTPGVARPLIANAKIDLADIYLLKGEWWESTLLYSQVEKSEKESEIAHIAKLKNAKLHYYNGDFELAKSHLDILKLATSREISNDAIELSIIIKDNTGLDTSETALKQYAAIELLVFQKQYDRALEAYEKMRKDFEGHSLIDEILWQEANIYFKRGEFDKAIEKLKRIVKDHPEDLFGDDAVFLIAKIYDEHLQQKDKAMEYYKKQFMDYSGSIHNVEARKRFRMLRGDEVN